MRSTSAGHYNHFSRKCTTKANNPLAHDLRQIKNYVVNSMPIHDDETGERRKSQNNEQVLLAVSGSSHTLYTVALYVGEYSSF